MTESSPSWIALDQPELRDRLHQLEVPAAVLQSHWREQVPADANVCAVLEWHEGMVQLRPLQKELGNPVSVDFLHGKTGFRALRFQHEMIVKAVAGRSGELFSVIDCTAGLGRDGFLLAAAGFRVTLIERQSAIACLLLDGLQRAQLDMGMAPVCARIRFQLGSAQDFLSQLEETQRPDVICLDPMFPDRTKAALVKKEMRIFRELAGDDGDAGQLLDLALQKARKRVVVKRPRKADSIGLRKPGHQLLGKSSRFDIYPV